MKWNLYFTYTGLIIQMLLLWFFKYAKILPLKKNRVFSKILGLSMVASVLNITSMHIDKFEGSRYAIIVFVLMVLYITALEHMSYLVFCYIGYYFGIEKTIEKNKLILKIPIFIFSIVVLLSYRTNLLIYIDSAGNLQWGEYFNLVYLFPIIYCLCFLSIKRMHREDVNDVRIVPIYVCFIMLVMGLMLSSFQDGVFLSSIVISICELILFITLENPEFCKSQMSGTYNSEGFMAIIDEGITENKQMYVVGLNLKNIAGLRKNHGIHKLYTAIRQMGTWFKNNFKESYVFFSEKGYFVLVSYKPIDIDDFCKKTDDRLEHSFGDEEVRIYFFGNIFVFEDTDDFKSASEVISAIDKCSEKDDTNEVNYIDNEICKRIKYEAQVEKVLQQHILNGGIDVYYQPIYSVKTGKIEGGEALARLIDSEMGYIPPDEFITLAEKSGEITRLGIIIFDKICEFVNTNDMERLGIKFINVNLSAVQFQDGRLPDRLEKVAKKHGVDISFFDFEITETGIAGNRKIEEQLNVLREKGCTVSLDDFGMGYSNLTRLVKFPFTHSKLDLSLVWSYFSGENRLMEDVISIFKKENLNIVAEGVETKEMAKSLSEMNCDYLQGYYFSKPIPGNQFRNFVVDFNQ